MEIWQERDGSGSLDRAYRQRFTQLLDALALQSGHTVLDVGCGTGVLVPLLLERVGPTGSVHELDDAQQMISVNKRRHTDSRVSFKVGDIQSVRLPTAGYHCVVCFSALPHFSDLEAAFRNMSGALQTGGRLVVAHFNSSEEMNTCHRKAGRAVKRDRLPPAQRLATILQACTGLIPDRVVDVPGFYLVRATK